MTTKTNTGTSCRHGRQPTNDEIKQRYAAIMDSDTQFGYIGNFPFLPALYLAAAAAVLGILVYAMLFV